MSLYTDLQQVLVTQQNNELDSFDSYMTVAGPQDLKSFLSGLASKGKTRALLHIEKQGNPEQRLSFFQSLRGTFGETNPQPARGIDLRNDTGWFFFNMPSVTGTQFEGKVNEVANYLTGEGLTVESISIGATIADLTITWE